MRDLVVAGVDTHRGSHVACVLAESGAKLGTRRFMADEAGYGELVGWVGSFGTITMVGVEGTGSWGAGLTRTLVALGISVVEINQCNRGVRRLRGKDDAIDAESAARAVLAGTHAGAPKRRDGAVEAIRALRVARCGAIKAKTASINQVRSLIASSPEAVRAPLRHLKTAAMIIACAHFRIRAERSSDACVGTRMALRSVARRYLELDDEAAALEKQISVLVREAAPALVMLLGVGPDHAGQFLVTAGDNPDRLRCEASFAACSMRLLDRGPAGFCLRHPKVRAGWQPHGPGLGRAWRCAWQRGAVAGDHDPVHGGGQQPHPVAPLGSGPLSRGYSVGRVSVAGPCSRIARRAPPATWAGSYGGAEEGLSPSGPALGLRPEIRLDSGQAP
jgi:transposase